MPTSTTATQTLHCLGHRRPELVGDERVQERIETTVDVEQQSHDRWQVHMTGVLFVGVELEIGVLLPQQPDVVRQHAHGE